MELDQKNSTGNVTFTRRYLDTNRVTYEVKVITYVKVFVLMCLSAVPREHEQQYIRHCPWSSYHQGLERARSVFRPFLPVRYRSP